MKIIFSKLMAIILLTISLIIGASYVWSAKTSNEKSNSKVSSIFDCSNLPTYSNSERKNTKLTQFINQQKNKLVNVNKKADKDPSECTDVDYRRLKQAWKDNNDYKYFDLDNYIYSVSSMADNTCKQQDVKKLIELSALYEKEILASINKCNVSKMYDLEVEYIKLNKVMILIRDGKTGEEDEELLAYWDEELYKNTSTKCKTNSWQEVTTAFCELKDNVKSLMTSMKTVNTGKPSNNDIAEQQKKEAKREKIAREQAVKFLESNIDIPFFKIKVGAGKDTKKSVNNASREHLDSYLVDYCQKVIEEANYQDYYSNKEKKHSDCAKIFNANELILNVTDKYSQNNATKEVLTYSIKELTKNFAEMHYYNYGKTDEDDLYDLVDQLLKTEKHPTNTCTLNIPNH